MLDCAINLFWGILIVPPSVLSVLVVDVHRRSGSVSFHQACKVRLAVQISDLAPDACLVPLVVLLVELVPVSAIRIPFLLIAVHWRDLQNLSERFGLCYWCRYDRDLCVSVS